MIVRRITWDDIESGKCLNFLMKNEGAISPEALYKCKVLEVYKYFAVLEVCPIKKTMCYETYLNLDPLSYRMCLNRYAIGNSALIYKKVDDYDEETEKRAG